MPIAQEKFYIPDDIAIGLATGQLKRFGGVVRHATGKSIVRGFIFFKT